MLENPVDLVAAITEMFMNCIPFPSAIRATHLLLASAILVLLRSWVTRYRNDVLEPKSCVLLLDDSETRHNEPFFSLSTSGFLLF